MPKVKHKNLVIYQTKSGQIEFRGDFRRDTIWASQKQIAEVFNVNIRTINEHLKNIYRTGELIERATIRKFRIVQKEGKRYVERDVNFYNLDAMLSVGYRVNSKRATQFRVWATKVLKQHLLQGYTINKKRMALNYQKFMRAVADVRAVLPAGDKIKAQDVLDWLTSLPALGYHWGLMIVVACLKQAPLKNKFILLPKNLLKLCGNLDKN